MFFNFTCTKRYRGQVDVTNRFFTPIGEVIIIPLTSTRTVISGEPLKSILVAKSIANFVSVHVSRLDISGSIFVFKL